MSLDEINKIPLPRAIGIIAILFGALIAPYWFLFQFAPSIFNEYELIKLLLLCISIGIPVIIINFLMESLFTPTDEFGENPNMSGVIIHLLSRAAVATAVAFYIPCAVAYWKPLPLGAGINLVIYIHIGFLVYAVLKMLLFRKKEKPATYTQENSPSGESA